MIKSKLTEVLKTLNTRERTRFKEYLYSPFFNKNKKNRALYEFVASYAPSFEHPEMTKTNAFAAVFGSSTHYNEYKINNIISDTLQHLYNYLAQTAYASEPFIDKRFLMEALLKKDLPFHVERIAQRYKAQKAQQPTLSYTSIQADYHLHDKLDKLYLSKNKRSYDSNLQSMSDYLDEYYFINKLSVACGMASRSSVINATYHCQMLDEIRTFLDSKPHKSHAIQIYLKALQMIQNQSETHYNQLIDLLNQHANIFPATDLFTLYNYALNFCIQKINAGAKGWNKQILDLYKVLLAKRVLHKNGLLKAGTFKNILTVGIRLENFEWTEQFINTYTKDLQVEDQENAINYSRALLAHAQANYTETLQQLLHVEFSSPSYHASAKILQLQTYFELEENEAFYSLTEASAKYIQRNKSFSTYQKEANLNFIKFIKKLQRLKSAKARLNAKDFNKRHKKLQEELTKLRYIVNREYLNTHLQQLI